MRETRRIVLDGVVTTVTREDDELVLADGRRVDATTAIHLPPSVPTKIICIHLNYASRRDEFGHPGTATPTYFHKPTSCLNSHGGGVALPENCRYLNLEGEVGIVIGRTARHVPPDRAGEYIAGYTIANDFGLHDFRDTDAGSMLRVKGSDTLGAVGPGLVTDWDFRGKSIRTLVNGEVVQHDTTDGMIWDMHYLVADLARLITLEPGDLILSGTPANSRPVSIGDQVTVEVEGLGRLTNHIVAGPPVPDYAGAMPTDSEHVRGVAHGTAVPT